MTTAPTVVRPSDTPFARKHLRRNVTLLLIDCGSWLFGLAFFDPTTVLPDVLHRLHASSTMIGFARLVQILAFTLPALLAAHYIHGRTTHKRFLLQTCFVSRSGLVTLPVVLYLYADTRPGFVVAWFLAVTAVFWLADGFTAVSWLDIVAKVVHERVRGRFFGAMQMTAGLLAIGASGVVTHILRHRGVPFGVTAATLALGWFAGASMSTVALSLLREPPGSPDPDEPKPGFVDFLRRALPLIRSNARFRHLVMIRVLLDGSGLALPFYILYAHDHLGYPLASAGMFVLVKMIGKSVTGPLWGWVVDRFGPMAGVRGVAGAIVCIPVCALVAGIGAPWLMIALFFLSGATEDAYWMTGTSAMLEAIDERDRPLAVGVATIFQAPAAVYSPVGGALLVVVPYTTVFAITAVVTLCGLVVAIRTAGRRPVRTARAA